METQKELLTKHRAQLDSKFKQKYPNGRYTIQRWRGRIGIYWVGRRPTSHVKPHGVGVEAVVSGEPYRSRDGRNPYGKEDPHDTRVDRMSFQPCSFGKCTHYPSMKKMLRAAGRLGVPNYLVEAFMRYYKEMVE